VGELRCSGRISSYYSTSRTGSVTLVTTPVISHVWGNTIIIPAIMEKQHQYHAHTVRKLHRITNGLLFGYNHVCLQVRIFWRGRRGRDRMVVGFIITYATSAYWRGILDTSLCEKVCQWLTECRWFFPSTLVFSTNKTDLYDKTEILLKGALNIITLTLCTIFCLLTMLWSFLWFTIPGDPLGLLKHFLTILYI